MATKVASKYDSNSDTDASSDYDFDLSVEEEQLLETLVADASSHLPVSAAARHQTSSSQVTATSSPTAVSRPSGWSGGAHAPAGVSSLRADIADVFATNASVKSLYVSELGFNEPEARQIPGLASHNETLAGLGASRAQLSPNMDSSDDELEALVQEAERRAGPKAEQASDIQYPDLSRALSGVLKGPADHQESESDGSDNRGHQQKLSPLVRFRSFPKKPFSVSDLIAGAWCELQYYYTLTKLPGGRKTRTVAMKGGSKVHKQLEEEIYSTVTIEITKKEDAFGLKLWNIIQGLRTLRDKGMTRELEVWGLVDGHVVNGIIDNLSYENPDPEFEEEVRSSQGSQEPSNDQKITTFFHSSAKPQNRQIFITDVKTRASRHIPSGAALRPTTIQLFLYHRFLSEMAAGRLDFLRVLRRYGLDPDETFSDTFVAQIGSLHDEIFQDAVDDSVAWTKSSTSEFDPASSSTEPASPVPDLIRYGTLRQLISLLETELRLTFPEGADSLGSLVNVEYRKRARRNADGVEDPNDEESGTLLGTNVLFVDPHALDLHLQKDLQWWEGRREPDGVMIEEAYKCRSCEFADECTWRQKQDADILQQAKKRIAARSKK